MTETQIAYEAGFDAYFNGDCYEDNPYENELAEKWHQGMAHAERMGDGGDYEDYL